MLLKGICLATHFSNTYQIWSIEEVTQYIRELAEMGANAVGVWFDVHEYRATDLKKVGSAAWDRLHRICRISQAAHDLDLKVVLYAVANEAYQDQVTETTRAETRGRAGRLGQPTQLCISRGAAANICVENIADLVGTIPYVDYLITAPYEQGGCDCLECAPWARTYVLLSKKILEAARTRKPGVELILSAWCMNETETGDLLNEARADLPGGLRLLFNQDSRLADHGIDARQIKALRYSERAELIGLAEISVLFDAEGEIPTLWGIFGANPIPRHLAKRFRDQRPHLTGMIAASEGIHDDINKWVLLRLGINPDQFLDDILAEYAERFFVSGVARDFVQLVHRLEDNWKHRGAHFDAVVNLSLARLIETRLSEDICNTWRWRLVQLRCRLDEIVARGRERGDDAIAGEMDRVLDEVKKLYRCAEFTCPVIAPAPIADAAYPEN